jgi:hypothetical protein
MLQESRFEGPKNDSGTSPIWFLLQVDMNPPKPLRFTARVHARRHQSTVLAGLNGVATAATIAKGWSVAKSCGEPVGSLGSRQVRGNKWQSPTQTPIKPPFIASTR